MKQHPFQILTDKGADMHYEENGIGKTIFNFFIVPLLNILPQWLRRSIARTHKGAATVIINKTSHKALEVLYHRGNIPGHYLSPVERIFHRIWFNTNNAKAVRNRLRIVKREITNELEKLAKQGRSDVAVLSIAAGSARAVLESIKEFSSDSNMRISALFLDKSSEALTYSKRLREDLKLHKTHHVCEWVQDTVSKFPIYAQKYPLFDIIEMVGLLDYFSDEKVVSVFADIYAHLEKGGMMVTANINKNKEQRFVTHLIGWQMIYRSPEELAFLAQKAGFEQSKITVIQEPLKIHSVLIARK